MVTCLEWYFAPGTYLLSMMAAEPETMLPSLSVRSFWTLMNGMCPPGDVCRRFCKEYHTCVLGVLAQNTLAHNV